MKYYLILSDGEYSDYSPTYYVGSKEITQDELDKKGKEVGNSLYTKLAECPTRAHDKVKCAKSYWRGVCDHEETEPYWPDTLEKAHPYQLGGMWFKEMEKWIKENGFEELPKDIPEINVSYSEIPH
jgi:hypothetical protein